MVFAVTASESLRSAEPICVEVLWVVCLALVVGLTCWLLILLTRLHRLIPVPGEPGRRRRVPAAALRE